MIQHSWSGGKDSTAAALLRLKRNEPFYLAHYTPMLTKDIPLIRRPHYEYIMETIEYFKSRGIDTEIAHGMTYHEYCMKYAFPSVITRYCHFRDYSKIASLNNIERPHDFTDVGIAADEYRRLHVVRPPKVSILIEEDYSEFDAKRLVKKEYHLSPLYDETTRDGCIICPNGSQEQFNKWLKEYPQAKEIILEIQEHQNAKGHYPLRHYKNFI